MQDKSIIPPVYIYLLIDPLDMRVRYVGKTRETKRRLYRHLRDATQTAKTQWINGLALWGFEPLLEVIAVVDALCADEEERFWIAALRERGYALTNETTGGEGHYTLSETARRKISLANGGIVRTVAFREHVSVKVRERWQDPDEAAKMMRGVLKAGKVCRNYQTPETKAKISATMKGVPKSAETRARMSAARRARNQALSSSSALPDGS